MRETHGTAAESKELRARYPTHVVPHRRRTSARDNLYGGPSTPAVRGEQSISGRQKCLTATNGCYAPISAKRSRHEF